MCVCVGGGSKSLGIVEGGGGGKVYGTAKWGGGGLGEGQ